jgi:hypothetical protein
VESLGVVPVHPGKRRELDVFDRPPRPSPGRLINSVLYRPFVASANASPTDPTDGVAPSSAERSPSTQVDCGRRSAQ